MTHRAVLAGCGAMARGWLRALRESPELAGRVEIVGLVDLDLGAAQSLQREFGISGAVTGRDLDAVLTATKAELMFDVVVPSARRDVVLTGLRRGCHVLSEKPMAASLEEAGELVAAAERAGRTHAIIQNRRYVDGVRRIRETIEQGTLGQLTALHADFFIGAHFGGFREQMRDVLLLDMAVHTFDAARFMADADPLAVYCLETNPAQSWYAHGAAANAIFEFSQGVVFTYRGSWVAEGAITSWESQWRIVGTAGTLLWDGAGGFEARVRDGESGLIRPQRDVAVPPPPRPAQTHGHASVIAEFIDAIDAGRAPETDGHDNIRSLAMVFGAIESANRQQRVAIRTKDFS